jgi:hypothetical protein
MEIIIATIVTFLIITRLLGVARTACILVIVCGALAIIGGVDLASADLVGSLLAHNEFTMAH